MVSLCVFLSLETVISWRLGKPAIGVAAVYTATNRCQEINFAIIAKDSDFSGNVRVCFVRAGYCNSWKPYNSRWDVWKVIASDVRDGTTFRIELNYDNTTFGHYQGRVSS